MYRAVKMNISKLARVAAFNDDFRDALKGNHGSKKSKGFVSGLTLREEAVKFGITGAVWHPQIVYNYVETSNHAWATSPEQCINYVSCHDNYTLFDKLQFCLPKASDNELRKSVKLAGALILTSQGVPFLHSGIEFCRTKGGNGNSYKSPDEVNKLDWTRKAEYIDVFEYYKNLIQLRKNHPAFRMSTAKEIAENLKFCHNYMLGLVSYCINGENAGDAWKKIIVIFNGNRESLLFELEQDSYTVMVRGDQFSETGIERLIGNEIIIEPVSMTILLAGV
jgi:pullulanase